MNKNFPHLDDTNFPILNNVDVYKYKNNFDYTRWAPNTSIKVCNVPWDSSCYNKVKFSDDKERNEWFDNLEGHDEILLKEFRILPDGHIKLPIPFDVMHRYNFIYVHFPIASSDDEHIEYETDNGIRDYFYFINDVDQLANNCSDCTIELDYWTTYINDVDISYMMLKRGHAPVACSSVEDYLNDPINNSKYLLADDINFGSARITSESKFAPIAGGELYVILATTMDIGVFSQYGTVKHLGEQIMPNYTDQEGRNGKQANPGDIRYSELPMDPHQYGSAFDFSDLKFTVNGAVATGGVPNNIQLIAFRASDYGFGLTSVWDKIKTQCPQMLQNIKAQFILPENYFVKVEHATFLGYDFWSVDQKQDLVSIMPELHLKKSDFNFDDKYSDLAKLYTFPYSYLEASDNDNTTIKIRIEDTSKDTAIMSRCSLVYPSLKMQAFFANVGGTGAIDYEIRNINNHIENRSILNNSWQEMLFEYDIPTFAIYMAGYDDFAMRDWWKLQQRQFYNAQEYNIDAQTVNTNAENTFNSLNMQQTNSNNTAGTDYNIAIANNATEKTNADTNTSANYNNSIASINTTSTNNLNSIANHQSNWDIKKLLDIALLNNDLEKARSDKTYDLQKLVGGDPERKPSGPNNVGDTGADAWLNAVGYHTDANTALAYSLINTASGALQIGANYAAGTEIGAGLKGGAATINSISTPAAAFSDAVGIVASDVATAVTVSSLRTTTENNLDALYAKAVNAEKNSNDKFTNMFNHTRTNLATSQKSGDTVTKNSVNLMTTNNSNTTNTDTSNAKRTNDAELNNHIRTKTTDDANAKSRLDTQVAANNNQRDSLAANCTYNQSQELSNLQRKLNNTFTEEANRYREHVLDPVIDYGKVSGESYMDAFKQRGVQIRIKTQHPSEIEQAGDQFLRYGYKVNCSWKLKNINELNVMPHFTYWEASDIWMTGKNIPEKAQEEIKNILYSGTTVWSNPDDIGMVSIYDNK